MTLQIQPWLLQHLTLLRTGLFLCCCGYWIIGWRWLKPSPESFRRGCLAALVQFWVGLLMDVALLPLGGWAYRDMPLSWMGVPVDLHLDWALIWGFGIVWLAERWPGFPLSNRQAWGYLGLWTIATLAFDACVAKWMIFLDHASALWWVMDLAFLFVVQAATLFFYASIGKETGEDSGLGTLKALRPWHRSWVYLSFFFCLLFLYLPEKIMDYNVQYGWWQGYLPLSLLILGVPFFGLGAWAILEFDLAGGGTPLPWDHPRRLVRSGPYAFVGNPMQISALGMAVALLLWRPSFLMLMYVINMSAISAILFRAMERQHLPGKFGKAWTAYASKVKDWRPKWAAVGHPILFYDGDCGLCQRSLIWLLRLDAAETFRFAPLGGRKYRALKLPEGHGSAAKSLWLHEPGAGLTSKEGRALLRAAGYLPFPICMAAAFQVLPGFEQFLNFVYRWLAKRRQRVCPYDPAKASALKKDKRRLP
jgi:protein-S-isoprenylcysteine O-methyltransferase Ste14/predicted DCC family thiol-disulfide oxidoreductase YuxK